MTHARYVLRLERLDRRSLRHPVDDVTEFFDLEDDAETEAVLSRHFVPMACTAEGETPGQTDPAEMTWLAHYVLRVYRSGAYRPVTSYRGWSS